MQKRVSKGIHGYIPVFVKLLDFGFIKAWLCRDNESLVHYCIVSDCIKDGARQELETQSSPKFKSSPEETPKSLLVVIFNEQYVCIVHTVCMHASPV